MVNFDKFQQRAEKYMPFLWACLRQFLVERETGTDDTASYCEAAYQRCH
jgi:hypothetical protein